ncbi:putative ABC transporter ATP-binding protein [Candidatus Tiddalikarchaeum anstoanum]|nr:putative ABC transporter ATP-binding protein [Candidatus Tiddalikarchaeum anstoanum]
MALIEVKNLCKYYNIGERNEVKAVDDISFKIDVGDFVAVVGPSGSGKSTLLHMVGCLDTPTKGSVIIDGVDVSKLSDDELANIRLNKIGFIFQTFNLIPGVNALENVVMPLVPYRLSNSRKEYARQLLHKFGILQRADHDPSELSGGEKQRVAISRSLINNPKLILADEPTGQLDSKTGREIIKLMHELNVDKKITFVIVTHDESLLQFVKRVIRLKDGKIVSDEHNGKVHKIV